MTNKLLCPSMMCADFGDIAGEISQLEAAGADMLHLDLMDGSFVPNYGMGIQDIEYIAGHSSVPCDLHMMSVEPGRYIERFSKMGVRVIYVHPEADPHVARTLAAITATGAAAGIAVNPGTAFATVEPLLDICEYVLLMTVNPGFAGQRFLPFTEKKIVEFIKAKQGRGYRLILDGACSKEVISVWGAAGVDGFVLGTSALFGKGREYGDIMRELRGL